MSTTAVKMTIAFGDTNEGEGVLIQYITDNGLELPCWVRLSDVAHRYNFGTLHNRGSGAILLALKLKAKYLTVIERRLTYENGRNWNEIKIDWKDKHQESKPLQSGITKPQQCQEINYLEIEPLIKKYVVETGKDFPCWISATDISQYFFLGRSGYHLIKRELEYRGRVFKKLVVLNTRKAKSNPKKREFFIDELEV